MGESTLVWFIIIAVLVIFIVEWWKRMPARKLNNKSSQLETVRLYTTTNQIEAHTLKVLLEEDGIPCYIESLGDSRFTGEFVDGDYNLRLGTAPINRFVLRVFEKDRPLAEELIKAYLEAKEKGNNGIKSVATENADNNQ